MYLGVKEKDWWTEFHLKLKDKEGLWWAWYPVKLEDGRWAWREFVHRTTYNWGKSWGYYYQDKNGT